MAVISWDDTELRDDSKTKFTVKDIKQLLANRNDYKPRQKTKSELMQHLKETYAVKVRTDGYYKSLTNLKVKELLVEHKLLGIQTKSKLKAVLLFLIQHQYNKHWQIIGHQDKICFDPIMLNQNEYFIVKTDGLYKYNIIHKQWNQWITFDSETYFHEARGSICIDHKDKKIYILHYMWLYIINYETGKIETLENLGINSLAISRIIFENGDLHLIGAEQSGISMSVNYNYKLHHYIFDPVSEKFNLSHTIKTGRYRPGYHFLQFKLIYLSSKQKILVFGGLRDDPNDIYGYYSFKDVIFSYCCNNRKWSTLTQKAGLPPKCSNFNCLITRNEQYVILLMDHRNICIASTADMEFKETSIVTPTNLCNAIVVDNHAENELLTFGFIRNIWKQNKIGINRFPPQYLIRLIQARITNEYVHLFMNKCNRHFCIPVTNIVKDIIKI